MRTFAQQNHRSRQQPGAPRSAVRSVGTRPAQLAQAGLSEPADVSEREAERMADRVLATAGRLELPGEASARILNIAHGAARPGGRMPPSIYDAVGAGGSLLEQDIRADMEQRFGFDFSNVRIHHDERAARSANELNADAYTTGRDIVFGAGKFAPSTSDGKRLLAHELAHVVQQSNVSGLVQRQPSGKSRIGRILSLKEIAADPKREKARKITGQTTAKVCRSISAGAGKQNCPATLDPGLHVQIVAEKAGGAWLQIVAPERIPGVGPKEPLYVIAAFVEEASTAQVPRSRSPTLKDIMRLDQTISIKGLPKDQPQYVDRAIQRIESAPLGPDIKLFAKTGSAGVSIPKGDFHIDSDPLSGWSVGHLKVYKSRAVAEAVAKDLMNQTPDTPIYTYYLRDGIIFPTTLSATTIPNLLPFIRAKRDQDFKDIKATADLAKAVAWWYVGARFPVKISSGGGAAGKEAAKQAEKAAAGQAEKEAAKQAEKAAAKQAEKEAAKQAEKEAAKQAEKEAAKQAGKKVPAVKPSAPGGWKGTLNAFGKEIGWPAAGKVRVPGEAANLAKLRNAGVTRQWAIEQARIYREVARLNPANPTATLRAEWLERIAVRLGSAP